MRKKNDKLPLNKKTESKHNKSILDDNFYRLLNKSFIYEYKPKKNKNDK